MLLFLFFNNCENDTRNHIYADSPIDWGQVSIEDTVKLIAVFHNKSKYDALIHYVETPCGCTVAIPRAEYVKKNDSVYIDIKYKPAYFDLGYIEKNIFVHLKNRNEPVHFLIKGRVKKHK
jgi:hypothetical protein